MGVDLVMKIYTIAKSSYGSSGTFRKGQVRHGGCFNNQDDNYTNQYK